MWPCPTKPSGTPSWVLVCRGTHDGPQDTLQLADDDGVKVLESVLTNELGKLRKVPAVLEELAAFGRLDELAVEVRRRRPIKRSSASKSKSGPRSLQSFSGIT